MTQVEARAIKSQFDFSRGTDVSRIERTPGLLRIHVVGCDDEGNESGCVVTFEEPLGFRVVDERDLMEFWPTCSTPNGWLFQILRGGWLDQERDRQGSLMVESYRNVREFLIAGHFDCVSVFSLDEPAVGD